MSLSEYVLAALVQYGLPALFGVVLIAATGVPLPATLVLIAAGSFVEQGTLDLRWVLGLAISAAVIGDNLGYWAGRWGGRRLARRLSGWSGGDARLNDAERLTKRWGGLGIFLSRWLCTPLGPPLNVTSGMAAYAWPSFLAYDVAGEVVWVSGYVFLGRIFNDQVQAMTDLVGSLSWVSIGVVVVSVLGWLLVRARRRARAPAAAPMHDATSTELP